MTAEPPPDREPAPPPAAMSIATGVAAGLLGVIAFAGIASGILIATVGTFGLSGPDAAAGGGIVTTGIGALVFGLVAAAAAIGLWRGRTWAWLAGFVIGLLGLVGCLVAGATSGFESPLVVGALISLGTVVCLALPGARRGSSLY